MFDFLLRNHNKFSKVQLNQQLETEAYALFKPWILLKIQLYKE